MHDDCTVVAIRHIEYGPDSDDLSIAGIDDERTMFVRDIKSRATPRKPKSAISRTKPSSDRCVAVQREAGSVRKLEFANFSVCG